MKLSNVGRKGTKSITEKGECIKMGNKNLVTAISIVFLGISIMVSGYFIGNAIKSTDDGDKRTEPVEVKVLNLSQVAGYLNMSEEELKRIIVIEKNQLEKTGSFYGKMFPYFTIDNKQYFYKNEIDEWLKNVTSTHREYNTNEGWLLN